jgi:hypothetical protein
LFHIKIYLSLESEDRLKMYVYNQIAGYIDFKSFYKIFRKIIEDNDYNFCLIDTSGKIPVI